MGFKIQQVTYLNTSIDIINILRNCLIICTSTMYVWWDILTANSTCMVSKLSQHCYLQSVKKVSPINFGVIALWQRSVHYTFLDPSDGLNQNHHNYNCFISEPSSQEIIHNTHCPARKASLKSILHVFFVSWVPFLFAVPMVSVSCTDNLH